MVEISCPAVARRLPPRPAGVGIERQRTLEPHQHEVRRERVEEPVALEEARESAGADDQDGLAAERMLPDRAYQSLYGEAVSMVEAGLDAFHRRAAHDLW